MIHHPEDVDLRDFLFDYEQKIANLQVWKFSGIGTTALELQIQRIAWLQTIVQNTKHHLQFLTAVFGDYGFAPGHTMDLNGRILFTANPFARQFRDDMLQLSCHDDASNSSPLCEIIFEGLS